MWRYAALVLVLIISAASLQISVQESSDVESDTCGQRGSPPCTSLDSAFNKYFHGLNHTDELVLTLDGSFTSNRTLNASLIDRRAASPQLILQTDSNNGARFYCVINDTCKINIQTAGSVISSDVYTYNATFSVSAPTVIFVSSVFSGTGAGIETSQNTSTFVYTSRFHSGAHISALHELFVESSEFSGVITNETQAVNFFMMRPFITHDSSNAKLLIRNSSFVGALTFGDGAALWAKERNSSVTIKSSNFSYNIASGNGGAFYIDTDSNIDVQNSTIVHNHANNAGGAGAYQNDLTDGFWASNNISLNSAVAAESSEFACLSIEEYRCGRCRTDVCTDCDNIGTCAGTGRDMYCFVAEKDARECPGAGQIGIIVITTVVLTILAIGIAVAIIFSIQYNKRNRQRGYVVIEG